MVLVFHIPSSTNGEPRLLINGPAGLLVIYKPSTPSFSPVQNERKQMFKEPKTESFTRMFTSTMDFDSINNEYNHEGHNRYEVDQVCGHS